MLRVLPAIGKLTSDSLASVTRTTSCLSVAYRFVEGWDGLCLQQLHLAQQAASQERVVLSTYPLGYCGDGAAAAIPDNASATLLCATGFNEDGLLRIQGRYDHQLACERCSAVLLQHTAKYHGISDRNTLTRLRLQGGRVDIYC